MVYKTTTMRFNVQDLLPIGLTLVVLGIGLAYGLNVQEDVKDDVGDASCAARSDGFTTYNSTGDVCYNASGSTTAVSSASYNGSVDAITGVAKLPSKLPLIVTVIVAAVIIGILVRYLMVRYG